MKKKNTEISTDFQYLFLSGTFIVAGILLFLSLFSYSPADLPIWGLFDSFSEGIEPANPRENWVGVFGSLVAFLSLQFFGYGAYAIALFLIWLGAIRFSQRNLTKSDWIAWAILFLTGISLLELQPFFATEIEDYIQQFGIFGVSGSVGYFISKILFVGLFGKIGSIFLLLTFYFSALLFCTYSNPLEKIRVSLSQFLKKAKQLPNQFLEKICSFFKKKPHISISNTKNKTNFPKRKKQNSQTALPFLEEKLEKASSKTKKATQLVKEKSFIPKSGGKYKLPASDLLLDTSGDDEKVNKLDLRGVQEKMIKALKAFGITVEAGDITRGPSVTRYELLPSEGLRVNKITQLEADIARATQAEKIHILAPIPGKETVGIDIANTEKSPVSFRELVEVKEFLEIDEGIPLALGKDVYGSSIVADLTSMPHLLIAGATGSGKSVCINALLLSMLYKFSPADLKLILIDPKMVEMQIYSSLPHLIVPVVSEPKKVVSALNWAVNEMQKRYALFSKLGVRNISQFRAKTERMEIKDPYEMPYLVIVIDELADLMQVASADIELCIVRLAQKARAAGIHLIVATQTPRADVITGLIKANIPCRIAFQVASKLDSRIILDESGAEKLTGMGDMLYLPPNSAKLERSQGAFVSEEEVQEVVKSCANQGNQEFHQEAKEALQTSLAEKQSSEISEEDQELLERCFEVMKQEKKVSTSLLQRRLRLGYTRAARMVDLLEMKGIVGAGDGAKPREILIDLDEFSFVK